MLNFETNIERDVSFISIFCINHRSIIQPFYTISNFYRITTTTLNTQNSTLSDKFAVTIETRRLTCFVGEERDKMELNSTENLRHDWELFQGWAIIAHCCSSRAITTTVIAWSMKPKRSFNKKKKAVPCDRRLSKLRPPNSTNFPGVFMSQRKRLNIYLAQHSNQKVKAQIFHQDS